MTTKDRIPTKFDTHRNVGLVKIQEYELSWGFGTLPGPNNQLYVKFINELSTKCSIFNLKALFYMAHQDQKVFL